MIEDAFIILLIGAVACAVVYVIYRKVEARPVEKPADDWLALSTEQIAATLINADRQYKLQDQAIDLAREIVGIQRGRNSRRRDEGRQWERSYQAQFEKTEALGQVLDELKREGSCGR